MPAAYREAQLTSIYDFRANSLRGRETRLSIFKGRVLLVVNTASKCGVTPQYEGLETLHEKYRDRGLSVLGFPCDQFGRQEPGDAEESGQLCRSTYGGSVPRVQR